MCGLKTRLACAGDYAAEHTFMTAEISLFCYRLQSLSQPAVKHFVRQFHRLRKYFLQSTEISNPSIELIEARELLSVLDDCSVDWKSVIAGYISFTLDRHDCNEFADSFRIAVPFRFVQRLVAERRVLLNKGMALLAPSQMPHVFAAVFRKWLKYGILLARMWQPHITTGDDRFKLLFTECRVNAFIICAFSSILLCIIICFVLSCVIIIILSLECLDDVGGSL